jgi:SAM-dependent methyltransferase
MQNSSDLALPKDCQFLKSTTQSAPLERLLAAVRASRLRDYISQKRVLDFGCGRHAWAARSIKTQATLVHGVDASLDKPEIFLDDVLLVQSIGQLPRADYQVIAALAVFEHIPPFDLVNVLHHFAKISTPDAIIVGTVPTPLARPVLEFLSFKLGLIDSSQINDHWVYYDDLWLKEIVALTQWKVQSYKLFQLGLNSEFVLARQS